MSIIKDTPELVEAGVISQQTADNIQHYYNSKGGQSQNKLLVVFGILGAVLVGLGIILIIAHNWDELSKITKLCVAFLPLVIGQLLCVFTLIKKQDSTACREGAAAFLFFAVGASISLVSQIYNISGDLSLFLLTWMLLCLPLIYVMRSSAASLLYLIGITSYATQAGYWSYPHTEPWYYWILLLLMLPHYYLLYKKKPEGNFMIFHNWIIPLSATITLGTVAKHSEELMFIAYISLFGLFYSIANMPFFQNQKSRNNGYLSFGSIGTVAVLLFLSFNDFWKRLQTNQLKITEVIHSQEFYACIILSALAGIFLYLQKRNNSVTNTKPMEFVFIFFILTFIIGTMSPIAVVLINLLVLAIAVLTIMNGIKIDHLGILNYGLLIIAALVTCRFFDTGLSFVIRGILFVLVGAGFFFANFQMIKKRKENV